MSSMGLAIAMMGSAGCGEDESGRPGEDAYAEPTRHTHYTFSRQREDGTFEGFTAAVTGEIDIGGETFWVADVGDPQQSNGLPMNEAYLRFDDPRRVEVAGGKLYSSRLPIPDPASTPAVSVQLDSPVLINIEPPVGEPQTLTYTGPAEVAGIPLEANVELTYTLEEENASVETAMGVVHGTRYFKGSATVDSEDLPAFLVDREFDGEVWYSDSIGVVAAILRRPPDPDVVFGLAGSSDLGTPGNIQAVGVVDASNPSFRLDTYDVNQTLDADKDTHAQMILELRYVDEDLARSDQQPAAWVEFGTVFGYFPSMLVRSPISFFHPDENGQGYTYWIGYVDQAAKNEPSNGIAYHVAVDASPGDSPVRATARILYKLAP